ncbi:DEAD/DEAH box helicase [Alkalilimnicola sp. S0819]|uniref:DEAD/DEAH box helicase n=1 Tax=Alkalilimnicola sp. S0819 TaxID=2613922 RepID=UPI001262098E|nr:DEAD/DEAH box helicase [Alkalilimnicola sp. S0819]KAB7627798.1 DEAD/DEAH box helicase [Alkalilimnicola sp. S0819]MPQ15428.1 DEAD/DEAH box helicase [Alkalilimnicola sp. S0819]
MSATPTPPGFADLGLNPHVLKALDEAGYEVPTPIQAQSIPPLLAGSDLLGQAQTGTGKTAAFALPLLSRLSADVRDTQILILAPTRELAIQVAEACQTYARHMPGFHVLPIYGGQDYGIQLRALRRGAQVVVGTPGRVMDHMRKGTLKLQNLRALVLDEADEMLRMGFIDDVDWILEQTPAERQVALFSATMPEVIRRVAHKHLRDPEEVRIAASTSTAKTIRQRYWRVGGLHKLEALTRLLEVEEFDAMLVFVRTKNATVELTERLTARGHSCEALNGDIPQNLRERTVDKLKKGQVDIVVATDVAARGLDVERISHVVNFDIPYDTEAYVHRIGRTGRAGRSGEAILFVAPREQRMLRAIERATRQPIEPMPMPSAGDVNAHRVNRFKARIDELLASDDLDFFQELVSEYQHEREVEPERIAAALARMAQGDEPFLLSEREAPQRGWDERAPRDDRPPRRPRTPKVLESAPRPLKDYPDVAMERYRVEVGHQHEVKPGNIVGAIANEADLDSSYIGHIEIFDDFTTVDLPAGMPKEVMHLLRKARVRGRMLELKPLNAPAGGERDTPPPRRKYDDKPRGKPGADTRGKPPARAHRPAPRELEPDTPPPARKPRAERSEGAGERPVRRVIKTRGDAPPRKPRSKKPAPGAGRAMAEKRAAVKRPSVKKPGKG